jgi:hypothetical protein
VDLGIHAIPSFENYATITGLASAISTQTLFFWCPFLLPSTSHILASSPTLVYGGTFFCLKKKGDAGGSKVARGAYLNLRDGVNAEYLNVPLSSSTRDWYKKWFYVQQEQEPFIACDVTQIPKQQESWSTRPTSVEMV